MKTWFTSDLHFYHDNVIEYSNRPFHDYHEMNERLIENWNNSVRYNDTVFILGDFLLGKRRFIPEINERLNGKKILIIGNHDERNIKETRKMKFEEIRYDLLGFYCVKFFHYMIFFDDNKRYEFELSHYPYENKTMDKRDFSKRQLKDKGKWLIHGHIHNNGWKVDYENKMINIGVDIWDYKPVSLDSILKIISYTEEGF